MLSGSAKLRFAVRARDDADLSPWPGDWGEGDAMYVTDFEMTGQAGRSPENSSKPVAESKSGSARNATPAQLADTTAPKGFVIRRDRTSYAGAHLIVDLKGAKHLDDVEHITRAFIESVAAAGATLLHIHLHHFSPTGGVSGVAVLAESHISIHTWPEFGYAAMDVFMCGQCDPRDTIPVIERAFEPETIEVQEFLRGEDVDCSAMVKAPVS
jgi:S-adenosylmethionine decarboxylase